MAEAASTQKVLLASKDPCISARDAVTNLVTGFALTKVSIHAGMVAGSTKTLLAKVNGNKNRKLVVITDSGVFTNMAIMIQTHAKLNANT